MQTSWDVHHSRGAVLLKTLENLQENWEHFMMIKQPVKTFVIMPPPKNLQKRPPIIILILHTHR